MNGVGTRDHNDFAARWLACPFPGRRFAVVLADACTHGLGSMWVATPSSQWTFTTYSLPVSRRFTRVPLADEAIMAMRDLASPVAAFVRERCHVNAAKEITVDALYAAYRPWCDDNGHPKLSKQNFGRDLRAAVPSVRVTRPREEGARPRVYSGIDLMRVCAHCGKPSDGNEELCAVGDETLWLHPECQRAYGRSPRYG